MPSASHTFSRCMFVFQTAHQHVQVPEGTDSERVECTLLPERRTQELQRLYQSTAGACRHSGALSRSCSWKRVLDFLLWFVILKNKKTNKNKKQSVAARLGDDFEMGQSFNEFIYRFREEQASWKVTIAKGNPAANISSFLQKHKGRRIFFFFFF